MFECRHQPFGLRPTLVDELVKAYTEPHRAYHDVSHITELLVWFDRVADEVGWTEPAEVYAAMLFHDAFYTPGAKDNEARSASWASNCGLPVDDHRVTRMILLTAAHGHNHVDDAETVDERLFLDADMAILGAAPDAFERYEAGIAREYAQVPRSAYRAGRRGFLAGLLATPRIYLTDYFHDRLDAQARANLTRVLERDEN